MTEQDGRHWSDRLKDAMNDADLKPAELARVTGLSLTLLGKYLAGKTAQPRGDTMERLASALKVPYLWLRDGVGLYEPPRRDWSQRRDPGPLDTDAMIETLRVLLRRLVGDEPSDRIRETVWRDAAHDVSDLWRTLYRQGHGLESALEPTLKALARRREAEGAAVSDEDIGFTASRGVEVYNSLAALYRKSA